MTTTALKYGPDAMQEIGATSHADGLTEDEAVERMPSDESLAEEGVDPGLAGDMVRVGHRNARVATPA